MAGVKVSSSDKSIVCLKAVMRLNVNDEEKLITKLQQTEGDWSIEVDRRMASEPSFFGRMVEVNIEVTKETTIGDTTAGINLYNAISNEGYVNSYKLCYQKKEKQDAMGLNDYKPQSCSVTSAEEKSTLLLEPYPLSPFKVGPDLGVGDMSMCLECEIAYCSKDAERLIKILQKLGGGRQLLWNIEPHGGMDRARILVRTDLRTSEAAKGQELFEELRKNVSVLWHRICYQCQNY